MRKIMIKVNFAGTVEAFEFDVQKLTRRIMKKTTHLLRIKGRHVASYIFVNQEEIHQINKNYRQIDRPTDVISFAYIDEDPTRKIPEELGDIFICVDKVFEQATEYGHTPYRECAFLITHGILHLLGYDHIKSEDEEQMFALQDQILDALNIMR